MSIILEELYHSNIRPNTRFYTQDSPFVQAKQLKQRNLEKLMATLDDSQKKLFEKYCDAQWEMEEITRYDTFSYALKFGILLMSEVFINKDEITGEGNDTDGFIRYGF